MQGHMKTVSDVRVCEQGITSKNIAEIWNNHQKKVSEIRQIENELRLRDNAIPNIRNSSLGHFQLRQLEKAYRSSKQGSILKKPFYNNSE